MARTVADLDLGTKSRVIEAAGRVFAEKGFNQATVREICRQARANVAAVNYYFGDKAGLYVEAMRSAERWLLAKATLPRWSDVTPPEQRLYDFIHTLLTRMLGGVTTTWHTQLMLREITQTRSACEELVRDYIRPQFELLQSILADLLPRETSMVRRHQIAFSIVGQCVYYRVAEPVVRLLSSGDDAGEYGVERLARHITDFSLCAIGRRAAPLPAGGAS